MEQYHPAAILRTDRTRNKANQGPAQGKEHRPVIKDYLSSRQGRLDHIHHRRNRIFIDRIRMLSHGDTQTLKNRVSRIPINNDQGYMVSK